MRVLAASFPDEAAAEIAKRQLERRLSPLDPGLRVAPLGQASDPDGPAAILAGRFPNDTVDDVRADVTAAGGELVIDVEDEF